MEAHTVVVAQYLRKLKCPEKFMLYSASARYDVCVSLCVYCACERLLLLLLSLVTSLARSRAPSLPYKGIFMPHFYSMMSDIKCSESGSYSKAVSSSFFCVDIIVVVVATFFLARIFHFDANIF